jgi:hypothetical protein
MSVRNTDISKRKFSELWRHVNWWTVNSGPKLSRPEDGIKMFFQKIFNAPPLETVSSWKSWIFSVFSRLKVLPVLFLRLQLFWDMTICHWTSLSPPFDGTYCFHINGPTVPEHCLKLWLVLLVTLCQATVYNTALVYLLHVTNVDSSSWIACLTFGDAGLFSAETSGNGHRKSHNLIPEDLNIFLAEIEKMTWIFFCFMRGDSTY